MTIAKHTFHDKPVFSGAHFCLELDGISKKSADLPTLRSVEGGGVQADVLSYQMGENGDVWRQLGKPKYSDIKLGLGMADVDGFRLWLNQFLKGEHSRKNGAIIAADYNYIERARREFTEAMIVGLGLPKWDANDKNQANITITLAPEKVVYLAKGGGGEQISPKGASEAKQKKIPACNFTFSIDGFEDFCKRVTKVEAQEIKLKTIEHHYGTRLEAVKIPGKIEWPKLIFFVPEVDADPFRELHNKRMAGERDDQGKGRGAKITFMNNAKQEVGGIEYMGVHIYNVQSEKADASSEEMKLVKIECEIEGVGLQKLADGDWFTG
ncbi:MAG: phage tail protein [Deltaproteobacteria bacterium]|nr:phage tail protein [Kofleriaceae bacterium]